MKSSGPRESSRAVRASSALPTRQGRASLNGVARGERQPGEGQTATFCSPFHLWIAAAAGKVLTHDVQGFEFVFEVWKNVRLCNHGTAYLIKSVCYFSNLYVDTVEAMSVDVYRRSRSKYTCQYTGIRRVIVHVHAVMQVSMLN